jgi:hypothetical protein
MIALMKFWKAYINNNKKLLRCMNASYCTAGETVECFLVSFNQIDSLCGTIKKANMPYLS